MNWEKHIFHWGKWNEPIGTSTYTAECLVKRSSKYVFVADVYKSLVNEHNRLKR